MSIKQRINALRFDLLTMRHARGFRKDIIAEKNRYIDAQINSWRVGRGLSEALQNEHAANMQEIFKAHYAKIIKTATGLAPTLIDGLKSAGPFEIKRELHEDALQSWFMKHGGENAKRTATTTTADIRRLLLAAFDAGEPESVVLRQGLLAKGLSAYRADTIARTETHTAAQFASDYTSRTLAAENGLTLEKAWMPVMDDRTREGHAAMDPNDWIGMDDAFDVDGESMDYPGEAGASPENVINCRCQLLKRVVDF